MLVGLLVYYASINRFFYVVLTAIVMTGTVMVSYTRARAENTIPQCKVGFLERPERVVLIIIGALFNRMAQVLWVIAVLSNITVIHRMIYTWQEAKRLEDAQDLRAGSHRSARTAAHVVVTASLCWRLYSSAPVVVSVRLPVLDAFCADQSIGDLLHILRLALHHHHLQTIVVIEMHVHRRKDVLVVIVLHVRQLLVQHAHVVVIDQRHRADHVASGDSHDFCTSSSRIRSRNASDRLVYPRCSISRSNLLQQRRIDGNSNAGEIAHAYILGSAAPSRRTIPKNVLP